MCNSDVLYYLSNLHMGGGFSAPPLLINRRLSAVALSPLANSDAWSIDPQRTIQLPPGAQSTPWSIDPQRTIEIQH